MSFRVEGDGVRLQVRIENESRSGEQVLEAVHACRSLSWWSCPSGECSKVGNCEAQRDGEAVILLMTPRAGETLSPGGVAECLHYVLGSAAQKAAH